jgi:hypothetical protein
LQWYDVGFLGHNVAGKIHRLTLTDIMNIGNGPVFEETLKFKVMLMLLYAQQKLTLLLDR